VRLSRPALETLAIVAYKQPVSRPEIDAVRGVNSEATLDNLLERRLLRIAGRKEGPGRPFVYETTREFLVAFGLRDPGDLPKIEGELVVAELAAEAAAAGGEAQAPQEAGAGGAARPAASARGRGRVGRGALERWRRGVVLDDGPARPDEVEVLHGGRDGTLVRLTFTEGRKHEVKRYCAALGHRVRRLRRVAFGPVRLGDLPRGRYRRLTSREVSALRAAAEGSPPAETTR